MANSHILEQLAPGRFRVVYHIAIPAGNNSASVPWRTALLRAKVDATKLSVLPDGDGTGGTISASEKSQLASGALYEVVREGKGQSLATVTAMFTRRSAETLADLQAELAQYGRTL